ncbi:methyltransferase [Candidatus Woesearchaeota archaeon]|nr:methyltransferase [Candidatus Woesearchaeota archaeon]
MLISFFKKPKETGAITISSKYLTNEIIKNIDFKNSRNIIELGPGLGTFTKAILKKANPDAKVVCFEINNKFCNYINKNCADEKLIVINAGAGNIRKKLNKLSIKKVDCIVSGLPFRNFSKAKKEKILAEVKNTLNGNGRFVFFQYTKDISTMLGFYFSKVKKSFVPLNIPPCFVYLCEN